MSIDISQLGPKALAQIAGLVKDAPKSKRAHKYHASETIIDGVKFPSKKEADRWCDLLNLQRGGLISNLGRQRLFALTSNNILICNYISDFDYIEVETGKQIVEDTKGFRTRAYIIKAKMFRALFPDIDFREV